MRLRRTVRLFMERNPSTWFTVQELADFVELCARRDMPPGTRVRLFIDGQEVREFRLEVTGASEE